MKHVARNVIDVLGIGESEARNAKEITKRCGYKDTRTTTTVIQQLRLAGNFICSNCNDDGPKGYYLAKDLGELRRYCRVFTSRIKEMQRTIKPIENYIKRNTGGSDYDEIQAVVAANNDGQAI